MRIGFAYGFDDAAWIGGRNYFGSLFRSLHALNDDDVELVLVTGKQVKTSLPEELPFLEVHRTGLLDRKHPAWLLRQFSLRAMNTDPLLATYLRQLRIDLLSHSGYLGPAPGLKTLPWLFDFQFMHLPEHWTAGQLRWVRQRYTMACAQGDGVIVSSEDALRDLQAFLPAARVPTHVLRFVSNPVDIAHLPAPADLQARYGLATRYFHLPNQFWTHKNHAVVVDALRVLRGRGIEAQVVCTGSKNDPRAPAHFDNLMAHAQALGVDEALKVLGIVPYRDTQALMSHATAVINPSRFEGWSTTVEEAKTLRKRLLLSDLRVHREQSPDWGRFFAPDDPEALAGLMQQCLTEPQAPLCEPEIAASYRTRSELFAREYLAIARGTIG